MKILTQSELKKHLEYHFDTGVFTRKIADSRRVKIGDIAGYDRLSPDGKRYNLIMVLGKRYLSHRLVWLYVHGCFPPDEIDHEDGNGLNNRIGNLRLATGDENKKNKRLQVNNTTGQTGVSFSVTKKIYQSYISVNGKRKHIGWFDDFFEAVCARKLAENKYGYHRNHGTIRGL